MKDAWPVAAAARGPATIFGATKLVLLKLVAFARLARLKFLVGGLSGGALGTAIAAYETRSIDWLGYALAQLTITAAHLMTQFANEYYDRESDALTTRTPYSGGSGVLVDGLLAPVVALRAALACMAISGCAIGFSFATGHVLAGAIGVAIIAFAWAYSAPPIRLLARGLGELDTVLVVAILVPLCAYAAQAHALDARALASTVPGALAMFVMMLCVELPDVAADAATGKRNLVIQLGQARVAELAMYVLGAYIVAVGCTRLLGSPMLFVLFEGLASVQIYWLARAFIRSRSHARTASAARELAERGVIFFATVSIVGALGYAFGTIPGVWTS